MTIVQLLQHNIIAAAAATWHYANPVIRCIQIMYPDKTARFPVFERYVCVLHILTTIKHHNVVITEQGSVDTQQRCLTTALIHVLPAFIHMLHQQLHI